MDIAIGMVRIEDGRSTGQRFVHHNVLDKTIALMSELGEQEVVLAAKRWRWPAGPTMTAYTSVATSPASSKVPKGTALTQALKNANAHRETFIGKDMPREAAYCELAAFCVQACMDEAA